MATAKAPKHVHIEAMQTAVPTRVATPGQSRRIDVASPLTATSAQSRVRMVFYYRNPEGDEKAAWTVAAWIKESLGEALANQPSMAGRLRSEESGGLHVKFNDTGIRLLQASVEMSMSEFLEMKDKEEKEAALADWVDVDTENIGLSVLCFIQVTRFQGDGYAIGISCSLLLADPLSLIKFLKSWADTHTKMLAQGRLSKNPMFHLGYFQRPSYPKHLKSIPLDSAATASIFAVPATTILFKTTVTLPNGVPSYNAIASACIKQAVEKLSGKGVSKFSVIANDESGGLKIESCNKDEVVGSDQKAFGGELEVAQWDETSIEELALMEGSKPVHVSYTIVSCNIDEGLVVIMPGDSELVISVTIPKEKV